MMRLLKVLNPMGCAALSRSLQPVLWMFALLPAVASAQALPDPTKPPSEISAPVSQTSAPAGSGLQSIMISATQRAAIINGVRVELGDMIGDAKLVEVSEGRVVLQGGAQGRQVLTLFPSGDIRKTVIVPTKDEKAAAPVVQQSKTDKKKKTVRKPAAHTGQPGKEGEKR